MTDVTYVAGTLNCALCAVSLMPANLPQGPNSAAIGLIIAFLFPEATITV